MPNRRGSPDVPDNPEIERSCRRRNAIKKAKRRQRLQERRLAQSGETSNTHAEHAEHNTAVFPNPTEEEHPAPETLEVKDVGTPPPPPRNQEVPFVVMAAARPWMDTEAPPQGPQYTSCIVLSANEGDFELKSSMLHMLQATAQFDRLPSGDPNGHIHDFKNICEAIRPNREVIDNYLRLKLFPFSITGKAKVWFKNLEPGSIRSWEAMERTFLSKYYPPKQLIKMRNSIASFTQGEDEPLAEVWERFKDYLRRAPNHGLDMALQVQTFYNGLITSQKRVFESVCGGEPDMMTPADMYPMIEKMVAQSYKWHASRTDT